LFEIYSIIEININCHLGGSIKQCSFGVEQKPSLHQFSDSIDSALQEVFLKTLGFFCALIQNGCIFDPENIDQDLSRDDHKTEFEVSPAHLYEALCD